MNKPMIFVLLLLALSSSAYALAYTTNPFWEVNGQNMGDSLTIEDGETALAGSPAFASLDCDVIFIAELMSADMSVTHSVLANTEVDTCSNVGFMYVPVEPSDYDGPGDYLIRFHLEDAHDPTDVETSVMELHVTPSSNSNTCPVFDDDHPSPQTLQVGVPFELVFTATDGEDDPLDYSADVLPGASTLSPGQGGSVFSWTPTSADIGTHNITFYVDDAECGDQQTITFVVEDEPVCDLVFEPIQVIPDTVTEGDTFAFQLIAHSSDPVTFSADDLPAGSMWDPLAGVFVWITDSDSEGEYDVDFTASTSAACSETQTVHMTVLPGFPACSDGVDNDGDGLVDFPADPGCDSVDDNDETDPVYECNDGLDNDADGLVDFPADPGCDNEFDDDETDAQNTCPVASFDWSPENPDMSQTVNVVSTSVDSDNDPLTFEWDLNNDGVVDSADSLATTVFNQAGSHPVTLTVSDGLCEDSVTNYIDVVPQCSLDVVSIDCLDNVIEGETQACTVNVDTGNTNPGGATVDLFYDDADQTYAGYCLTDSMTGACNAYFQAPTPGQYEVYATAQRNGCIADLDAQPIDNFNVLADGYDIANLAIYNNPGFTQEDYDFLRSQDMFVRFQVLDPFNDPVENAVTSVELLSPPGGHAYFSEYNYSSPASGYYDYFLQIPASHDFLGQSQVFVFQFNFQDGTGAQRVVGVNIHNNAPEIAEEGVVVMGSATQLDDYSAVTLNVVDPVDMTATFMVDGETVGPLMEGYSAVLNDGMVFHVHDIDFDNQPYTAVVSVTADNYLLNNLFVPGLDIQAPSTFDLSLLESDVEDHSEGLDWYVSGVDSNIFDVSVDSSQDVMTVTPLASGCDTFTLELWDLDNAVDTFDVELCSNPTAEPACNDGLDNDNDGLVDMNDPGCSSPQDDDEYNYLPQCNDGLDNDNDGLVDMADPGCTSLSDDDEFNLLPQCADGIDNDNDGLVDLEDPGCENASDDSEDDVVVLTQCSDGLDNDGDGLIDLNDPGCDNAQDDDESNVITQCSDGVDNDADGLVDLMDPGCLSPLDDDETNAIMPQCADGLDNDGDGLVDFPADPGCEAAGDNDETDVVVPACSDGVDNDGDGLVDLMDPGCTDANDNDEYNLPLAECSDGLDNDGDGLIDMADPDCVDPNDDSEQGVVVTPACADGLDNDGDGLVDLNDPGCSDALDDDEFNVWPACNDGLDNDGDGYVDMADPGCTDLNDNDEYHKPFQCEDGLDNDGDGKIDMADSGCDSPFDDLEWTPPPQCSDEIDNDHDGLVDLWDPDCSSENDDTEYPANPQCHDGLDNDGNGLIDLDDPHCYDQYDTYEGEIVVPAPDRPWNDRDDLLITRIDIDGFDVEDFAVAPGEYIMGSVTVENTLDHEVDDLKVRIFLDDYGLWATKTIHNLDAGKTQTVNMHLDVPAWLDADVYDLRITASNDDLRRVKYRHLIVV